MKPMTPSVFYILTLVFMSLADASGILYVGLATWEHVYASYNDTLDGVAYNIKCFKDNFSDLFMYSFYIGVLIAVLCYILFICYSSK